jgi:hypothetical protein
LPKQDHLLSLECSLDREQNIDHISVWTLQAIEIGCETQPIGARCGDTALESSLDLECQFSLLSTKEFYRFLSLKGKSISLIENVGKNVPEETLGSSAGDRDSAVKQLPSTFMDPDFIFCKNARRTYSDFSWCS